MMCRPHTLNTYLLSTDFFMFSLLQINVKVWNYSAMDREIISGVTWGI